jgi:hypothetical protein
VPIYAALILVWPYPAEGQRLSYVIVPVLLAQGLLWLKALGARRMPQRPGLPAGLLLGCLSLLLLPSLLLAAGRFRQELPPEFAAARHFPGWYVDDPVKSARLGRSLAAILGDLGSLGERVPPGDCIISIKPALVMLYTGRRSYTPPPASAGPLEFAQGMARCRYAYLMVYVSPAYPQPYYPDKRMDGQARALSILRDTAGSPPEVFAVLLQLGQGNAVTPANAPAGPRPEAGQSH